MPSEEIETRLKEIIRQRGYNVENIGGADGKGLPDTPRISAAELKRRFDANVSQLIDAIDDPDYGLTQAIFASMGDAGLGDMISSRYGTNRTDPKNNTYFVDHSRYAESIHAEVKGNILYLCVNAPE